jgi:hypothetical protein
VLLAARAAFDDDGHRVAAWGEFILVLAVLAIVVTAPLGAVLIAVLGPRWLAQAPPGSAVGEGGGGLEGGEKRPEAECRVIELELVDPVNI